MDLNSPHTNGLDVNGEVPVVLELSAGNKGGKGFLTGRRLLSALTTAWAWSLGFKILLLTIRREKNGLCERAK